MNSDTEVIIDKLLCTSLNGCIAQHDIPLGGGGGKFNKITDAENK